MRYILQVLVIAWCRVQYDSEIKQNIINKENICYIAKGWRAITSLLLTQNKLSLAQ